MDDTKPPSYNEYESAIPANNRYMLLRKIDFNHDGVDRDLTEIAKYLIPWKPLIPHLKLEKIDSYNILHSFHLQDPSLQTVEVLQVWKQRFGHKATYGWLLRVCADEGYPDAAQKIVFLLGGSEVRVQQESAVNISPKKAIVSDDQDLEFSDSMSSPQLYSWLLNNHMPPEDCQIINDKGINGLIFRITSEEKWKSFHLSEGALILIDHLVKKVIPGSLAASSSVGKVQENGSKASKCSVSSWVYPEGSHLETFNELYTTIKDAIVGSLDELCGLAIEMKLMNYGEKEGIFEGGNKFTHGSKFVDHFALRIKGTPSVLFQFIHILRKLGTFGELILKIEQTLESKRVQDESVEEAHQ